MVSLILISAIVIISFQIFGFIILFLLHRSGFLSRFLLAIYDWFVYWITYIIQCLAYRASTRHFMEIVGFELGRFTSIMLSHEDVQIAIGHSIVVGMNMFLRQPNLDEHVLLMSETVARTQPELARKSGEDFPKLVGSFLQGMLSSSHQKNNRPINNIGNSTIIPINNQNNNTATTTTNKGKPPSSTNTKSTSRPATPDPYSSSTSNSPTIHEYASTQSGNVSTETGIVQSPATVLGEIIDDSSQTKNVPTTTTIMTNSSPISFFGITTQNKSQRSVVKKDQVEEKPELLAVVANSEEQGKDNNSVTIQNNVSNNVSNDPNNNDSINEMNKEKDVNLLLPSLNSNNNNEQQKQQSENPFETFFGLKKRKSNIQQATTTVVQNDKK